MALLAGERNSNQVAVAFAERCLWQEFSDRKKGDYVSSWSKYPGGEWIRQAPEGASPLTRPPQAFGVRIWRSRATGWLRRERRVET